MSDIPGIPQGSSAPVSHENGFVHAFKAIGRFFHEAAVYVNDALVYVFGEDAAHLFAVGAEASLKSALGQIALNAVSKAAAVASGSEAKQKAFDEIVQGARAAGINAKDSIINLLIEMSLQRLKGTFGPA